MSQSVQPRRLAALQYRDFRLLWLGQLISMIGTQMQFVAVNWHVSELLLGQTYTLRLFGQTIRLGAEALGLGTLGLVRVIPIVFFALIGGMLADTQNRRHVMLWAQTASLLAALALAVASFGDHASIPVIYLLTAALAAAGTFDNPARQSLIPHLVPAEHFSNAISLNVLLWQIGSILGPAIGGVLIASFDFGVVYAINAATYLAVIVALLAMSYRGQAAAEATGLGWSSLVEGLRFTYHTRIIWSTMLLDFIATFFSSARTMLPVVARQMLGVGEVGYGILNTAQPVGAVLAGSIVALRKKELPHQGLVFLGGVIVYGLATALFGLSTNFLLSFFFMALTGAGDTVSTVIRGTLRQLATPDHLRGRMSAVNMIFFMGGPQLGELEAGLVGAWLGVPFAIVSGGVATILLTLWIAWKYPVLRAYTGVAALTERTTA